VSVYLVIFATGVITAALPSALIIRHLCTELQERNRWARFWDRQRQAIHTYNKRQRESLR
jgi:N-acetylglutamate synthase/N-acetylornithine aminotransferase